MPLRFRSIVPYTLPGVLALIGWWWYISRKKERVTKHDSEEGAMAMGLLVSPSPSEGSNGLVEKGNLTPKAREQRLTELEVVAQIHIPASKTQAVELQSTSLSATERLDPVEAVPAPGLVSCHQIPRTSSPTPVSPLLTQTPQGEHEAIGGGAPADVAVVTEPAKPTVTEQVQDTPEEPVVVAASEALVQSQMVHTSAADPANAERPEPEGEVAAAHEAGGSFIQNLQVELMAKDALPVLCSSTKDPLPSSLVMPAEAQAVKVTHESPISSQDSHRADLTSTLASFSAPGPQQENGESSSEVLAHLAAGLITEVISAATQEVLSMTSCPETRHNQPTAGPGYSSTPLTNGRPCSQQEPITRHMEDGPSPISHSEAGRADWREQKEVLANGCPVTWEPIGADNTVSHSWAAATPWQEGRLQAGSLDTRKGEEEVAMVAEDSACSTCHSEDGVSSEDQQGTESREDLIQVSGISERKESPPQALEEVVTEAALSGHSLAAVSEVKRLNSMCLRNGSHGTSETETDQSGGSDVNSMDSVDSGCTMGARDGSPAIAMGSELIVWEIEVPKHLVGRLIGKQGRYVSFLKQSSGAKIYISTLPYTQEFQICHIEGSQQQVDKALSLIGKKFKDLDLTNLYAPPPMPLPSLPMTSWLLLPSGVTVEVIVVNIVSAGHLFVQQHTHPTYHALRSLDQQMFLCYSQPGTPALPSPAEVGVICAAPAVDGAWWRAQVISFYKETNEVEIRYVDYGGYDRVKIDTLRQIRSDFVTLPFQGAEVLLDNIAPLPGENAFSTEATSALEEMTRGVALLAQVTNYDNNTGLPLVQMWNMVGEELVSVNRTLAERALGTWVEGF
uniref:Tudor domain-containing protein n=1 Tax=Esox lucius TaxID=8010 RepID=A0A6Q2Y460_ESOLU